MPPNSRYKGPIKLDGDPKGASVLILGAGLAGMTAALELRKAGYKVQVLEYNNRAGGRNWTLRGGDTYTELGGVTQTCEFEQGLYINPGPWRIPYHHRAHARLLQAARRRARAVHPGQPQCLAPRDATRSAASRSASATIKADFQGHISELLAKVTQQGKLDEAVTQEDQEILLQALRSGARSTATTPTRPISSPPTCAATPRIPAAALAARRSPASRSAFRTCCNSRLWRYLQNFAQHTISRPRCSSRSAAWT